MRFRVDPTVCEGYGTCADIAPEVFSLDPWGYAQAVPADVAPGAPEQDALRAEHECPVRAIRHYEPDAG
ncbi:MAG: ferredoxin [Actinobacteria bacterium]|nr:ferredoxin [Actinomycetota bacterium]